MQHHIDPLFQGYVEPRHVRIGNRQYPRMPLLKEKRDDRAIGAHHVPVAHDGKADIFCPANVIGRNEKFVGSELCRPIEVDRRRSLVRGKGHYRFYFRLQTGIDDVFRTQDIGLDTFHGVVLRNRYMLHCRCMDDRIYPFHRHFKPGKIPDIPNKKTNLRE